MNILLIYDSLYGNTEKIAKAIASGFSKSNAIKLVSVEEASLDDVKNSDFLIVGSPTQGGRPKKTTEDFLETIPEKYLKGKQFAAFDTRMDPVKQNFALKIVMNIIDYAAPKMDKTLTEKGGTWVINPEGFIVEEKEGPLRVGEEERAKRWAKKLTAKVGHDISEY